MTDIELVIKIPESDYKKIIEEGECDYLKIISAIENGTILSKGHNRTDEIIKKDVRIGDRVKFRTYGGWYNSGIIKGIDEESYLVEVDTLGFIPPNVQIELPYIANLLLNEIEKIESEE